jgi:multiple antibiotic resistance protein
MDFGIVDLFVIFLITLGPLKSAIVYVTLTADADAAFRRRIAIRTVLTSTVVAILFVVAGEFLLDAFHVSIPALKMAGGLILVLYALEMVIGSKSQEEPKTDSAAYQYRRLPSGHAIDGNPSGPCCDCYLNCSRTRNE